MNRLRNLRLLEEYRTDTGDLAADLFIPCLSVAVSYDRAVGYFTSAGLSAAARGLEAFVVHDGRMRLVASPALLDEDINAMQRGLDAREDVVERVLLRAIASELEPSERKRLAILSWLISEDRLDVRIAVPSGYRRGVYHEKIGLFRDLSGDVVAIAGSANETRGGLVENFESVDVFLSWDAAASRVSRKLANFEALWNDETIGLDVVSFPDSVRRDLLRRIPPEEFDPEGSDPSIVPTTSTEDVAGGSLTVPIGVELRPYQQAAVDAWKNNEFVGILSMATGSGKTITSLAAASELRLGLGGSLALVVLAPYVHLVDQWSAVLERWRVRPFRCYGASASWIPAVQERCDLFRAGAVDVLCLVATHTTASLESFKSLVRGLDGARTLVIADEAHHLGSDQGLDALPAHSRYRLALSATPERWEDPVGTRMLLDYFGGIVFDFGIAEAIAAGCLCRYEYLPEIVELSPGELDDYRRITTILVTELETKLEERRHKVVQRLIAQRSEILDTAVGKLERLRLAIERERPDWTLVYCANRTQLSAVMELMWDRGIASRQFTGEETAGVRQQILRSFAERSVPVLAAMKCLDEGVDVPEAREAYVLASSANPREFIQRRGRLLRTAPGKNRATIHDYVVVPDGESDREREIIKREVRRVVEFASAAENRSRALDVVWPVLKRNRLIHEIGN